MKADELIPIFKNLSEPNRFQIYLFLVREGEKSVGDISSRAGLSQPLTSHHLRHLRLVGLVKCRRDGNSIIYSACSEKMRMFCGLIRSELQESLEEGCGEVT